jgi:hypothetical protein
MRRSRGSDCGLIKKFIPSDEASVAVYKMLAKYCDMVGEFAFKYGGYFEMAQRFSATGKITKINGRLDQDNEFVISALFQSVINKDIDSLRLLVEAGGNPDSKRTIFTAGDHHLYSSLHETVGGEEPVYHKQFALLAFVTYSMLSGLGYKKDSDCYDGMFNLLLSYNADANIESEALSEGGPLTILGRQCEEIQKHWDDCSNGMYDISRQFKMIKSLHKIGIKLSINPADNKTEGYLPIKKMAFLNCVLAAHHLIEEMTREELEIFKNELYLSFIVGKSDCFALVAKELENKGEKTTIEEYIAFYGEDMLENSSCVISWALDDIFMHFLKNGLEFDSLFEVSVLQHINDNQNTAQIEGLRWLQQVSNCVRYIDAFVSIRM